MPSPGTWLLKCKISGQVSNRLRHGEEPRLDRSTAVPSEIPPHLEDYATAGML